MQHRTAGQGTVDREDPAERTRGNVMLVLALASICLIAIAIATRTSAVWWILAITSCGIHDRIGAIMVRKAEAIGDRGAQEGQHAGLRAVQA